jgi:single-strand DNA-binding protein
MAKDLNKVMIIGRLGKDPEMRYIPSGTPVARFSVATGRTWTSKSGEKRSETEWFNVVAWGGLAEVCNEFLSKGQRVYIEGRMQTRSWEDASGVKRNTTELIANEMIILDEKSGGGAGGNQPDNNSDQWMDSESGYEEDEFPF